MGVAAASAVLAEDKNANDDKKLAGRFRSPWQRQRRLGLGTQAFATDDVWPDIQRDVFDGRPITEDATVTLEAPYRAEDAATVPLTMRIPASAGEVKSLTLVIDKNPAPVAATFTFGAAAGKGERMLSTRVRIDMYSNVRAVVETADGKLHMATKFVKASGGCSAAARRMPTRRSPTSARCRCAPSTIRRPRTARRRRAKRR